MRRDGTTTSLGGRIKLDYVNKGAEFRLRRSGVIGLLFLLLGLLGSSTNMANGGGRVRQSLPLLLQTSKKETK